MTAFLRTLEFLSLGLWLGGDVFLSFVVAPGAFHVLATRDEAGLMVGFALTRMHFGGIICGVVFLVARLARSRSFGALLWPAWMCVLVMMVATLISQFAVSAKMAALRMQMGSIQGTAADSGLLAEFSRLHSVSVSLESVVLLAGTAAMFLLVREVGRVA